MSIAESKKTVSSLLHVILIYDKEERTEGLSDESSKIQEIQSGMESRRKGAKEER